MALVINTKQAIIVGLAAEAAAVAILLTWYGTGPDGAVVAARVTARVSALVFSLALAMRSQRALGASLMYGFVTAHLVHYAAVAYLASVAIHHHLQDPSARTVLVVAYGTLLIAGIAITTNARKLWLLRTNAAVVYLAWLSFLGGAAINASGLLGQKHWAALIPVVPLVAAMGYHLRAVAAQRPPASVAAGAS